MTSILQHQTLEASHEAKDEDPVKVPLPNVKDIFIWGLKRSGRQTPGRFHLNILGSQHNIPLTPIGGDEKCYVHHVQLTLNDNEINDKKGLYFQISLINVTKSSSIFGGNNNVTLTKKTIIGDFTNNCNPKPKDSANSSWRMAPTMTFFILDFEPFNASKSYFSRGEDKQEYYGKIMERMFDFSVKQKLNIDIAPATVLNILFASLLRIVDKCCKVGPSNKLIPEKVKNWNRKAQRLCNDSIEHNVILDWQRMIRNLTLMCFLAMLPQTDKNCQTFHISGPKAFAIYTQLIKEQKFGNKEIICKQIDRLLGDRMQKIQYFFWDCAFYDNPKNIERYYWILWLNLLYHSCTSDDYRIGERMVFDLADRMYKRPPVLFDHGMKRLHEAALAELSLKLEKRVLPLEIEATKLFVDSRQDGKYQVFL